ncbi:MAG: GNAT family N-acetyltransferase, partial [Thermodesulfobacteriota bacterium]
MKTEITEISKRLKKGQIGIKDTLSMIDMTLEDQLREQKDLFPYEVFEGLNELIDKTVHGTKIQRFRPRDGGGPFHTFEIHTEEGEVLGYLNMIYLRKPISSYYLVYVEVSHPFRGRGLGNKILKAFKEFVEKIGAVGLLDNIILPEEPTYNIYSKLGWKPVEDFIGRDLINSEGHYMVFIPESLKIQNLREKLIKLLLKVMKKRPIIDMHDNEVMVKRTISEFRSVNEVLMELFKMELLSETSTPFMRFMFTKFVTKVLGFRRRISTLLGFTGGESLEQISISEQIKSLPIQPYSLWSSKESEVRIWGEEEIIDDLPLELKREPTLYIENLPLYKRPYLNLWLEKMGTDRSLNLKIGDIIELGFDPTKLREFHYNGTDYIFERTSPRFLTSTEKKRKVLPKIAELSKGLKFRNTIIQMNPILVLLRDKENVYLLRRKLEGIHLE